MQRRPFARKESPDRFEMACPSGRGRAAQQGLLASNPETSEAESQCLRKRKSKGSPAGIFLLRKLSTTSRWSSGQSSPRREAARRKRKKQTTQSQQGMRAVEASETVPPQPGWEVRASSTERRGR